MILLTPREASIAWDRCRALLEPAFNELHTDRIEDYYLPILGGEYQLWITENMEGAVMTSISTGSNGSVLNVNSLGGKNLKDWAKSMEDSLTDFAKENGCKHIEAYTRKGFSRYVPSFQSAKMELYVKKVGENG